MFGGDYMKTNFTQLTSRLKKEDPYKFETYMLKARKKYLSFGYKKQKINTNAEGTIITFVKCVTFQLTETEKHEIQKQEKKLNEKYKK